MLKVFAKSRLYQARWLAEFPDNTESLDIQFNEDGLMKIQHLRSLLDELGFPDFTEEEFNALYLLLRFIRPMKPGENSITV